MNLRLKRLRELAAFFFQSVRQEGLSSTLHRAVGFFKRRMKSKKGRFLPPPEVLEAQRAAETSGWPVISILVPVYNTPMHFLKQMVESVQAQTCKNWERCV